MIKKLIFIGISCKDSLGFLLSSQSVRTIGLIYKEPAFQAECIITQCCDSHGLNNIFVQQLRSCVFTHLIAISVTQYVIENLNLVLLGKFLIIDIFICAASWRTFKCSYLKKVATVLPYIFSTKLCIESLKTIGPKIIHYLSSI